MSLFTGRYNGRLLIGGDVLNPNTDLSDIDEFSKSFRRLFIKNAKKYFNEDVNLFLLNWHEICAPIELSDFHSFMSERVYPDMDNSKKNVIIVSWGWHSELYQDVNIALKKILHAYGICEDAVLSFDADLKLGSEHFGAIKNIKDVYTWAEYKGSYFIFLPFDATHNVNDSASSFMDKIFTSICLRFYNKKLFKHEIKECKEEKETNKCKLPFKSILKTIKNSKIDTEQVIHEMLDKVDYKNITSIVNSKSSFDIMRIARRKIKKDDLVSEDDIRKWLKDWAVKKYPFYLLFGRKFKISSTSRIKKDELIARAQLSTLFSKFKKYYLTLARFNNREYLANRIYESRNFDDYFSVKKGTKLSKFLSSLFEDEEFDIEISKFFQDNKVDANLTISIDPYDYLTSSITKNKWRSCHHFINGECGIGSASYMFDPSTVVSYMSDNKEYEYEFNNFKFNGNSKSWRQMISINVNTNSMIFNRQYPQHYSNKDVSAFVRHLIEKTISEFCNIDDYWIIKNNGAYLDKQYINAEYTHHWDDIPANLTVYVRHKLSPNKEPIIIGSSVKCPNCNKNILYESNNINCDECMFEKK